MEGKPEPLNPLELALLLEETEDVSDLDGDETQPVDELTDDGDRTARRDERCHCHAATSNRFCAPTIAVAERSPPGGSNARSPVGSSEPYSVGIEADTDGRAGLGRTSTVCRW
jgi:hypothetical protein